MKALARHLVIAVIWMFLWGTFDVPTLLVGFAIAYALLGLLGRGFRVIGDVPRVGRFIDLSDPSTHGMATDYRVRDLGVFEYPYRLS